MVDDKVSSKVFTEKQIEILSHNRYVKNISTKAIPYTDKFKRIFIMENENGKFSPEIFEKYGFDINILGMHRVYSSGKRWRATYRKNGICG